MKALYKYMSVLILILTSMQYSYGQLSPGPLSEAHSHLEGLKKCTQCHTLGDRKTTVNCLNCHSEIQDLQKKGRGYHASLEVKGKNCAECHSEHHGRNFDLARFDVSTFNHSLSGYELEGRHGKIECSDCHNSELIQKPVSQKKGQSYLGLGTSCLSCHDDFHQETFLNECLSCHDQNAFRPAPGFDHSRSEFPLRGKHQLVKCSSCHPIEERNGVPFQVFSGIEHSSCTNCHADPHNNRFGNSCTDCHNENSFRQVNNISSFNHDETDFPLLGMHKAVNCKSCHKSNYTQNLSHNSCAACHEDYHRGQFKTKGRSPDCSSCHNVNGFSPSDYTIERHNAGTFPLEGSHLATPCFSCHQENNKWKFSGLGNSCAECHVNSHGNAISEKFIPEGDCRSCHSISIWKEIQFDHGKTEFALEGQHEKTDCKSCHYSEKNHIKSQQFAGLTNECASCHADIHFAQFIEEGVNECARCHTPENWHPEKFNHDSARFILEGKHSGLDCVQCHTPTDGLIENYVVYKFEDITCESCH